MVFERASTGRLAAALVWGLGLWVGAGVGRKILRWRRDPVVNAEAFGLARVNEES
jgi:short subunit fatty acids transporter